MAGGKQTPRQKMIGMMYLVLTAMLALNVSAEVLEAFVLVDNGLNQTLKSFRTKNEDYYTLISKAEENNKTKAEKWRLKADAVKKLSSEFYDYIQEVKVRIVKTSDGEAPEAITQEGIDGFKVKGKADTSIPANILLGPNQNGEAYELKKRIEKYKEQLLALIDNRERFSVLTTTIDRILDTTDPPMTNDGTNRTWETSKFEGVPLISTLPLLSKFQVDVLNCEALMLDHFFKQIDAADLRVNSLEAVVIPDAGYVIKGDKFKANIMLAAYDNTQQPVINVNGANVRVESGKGIYEALATSVGPKNLKGSISVKGPDGEMQQRPIDFTYQVIEPSFTVSPTKMNVLYRGIDNPLELSVSGVPSEKITVRISNADFRKTGLGYMVKPGDGRTCDVTVYATINGAQKSMGTSTFRVKQLPPPIPRLDGASGKTITRGNLISSLGIRAEMPQDFDFDLKYTIKSFVISGKNNDGYELSEASSGAAFNDRQKAILSNARAGNRIFVTEIKAAGPDGKIVELQDLVYKIR